MSAARWVEGWKYVAADGEVLAVVDAPGLGAGFPAVILRGPGEKELRLGTYVDRESGRRAVERHFENLRTGPR